MQLKERIIKEIYPELLKTKKPILALPRIQKMIVTVGIGPYREQKEALAAIEKEFAAITGQKPKTSAAKKSIAGFKLREGQTVGYVVTLRDQRMWDFLEKVITVVYPRMRDFDGVSKNSFDKNNNLTMSIKEQLLFPEIRADESKYVWGMGITLVIKNAQDRAMTEEYLKQIGLIFK